MAYRTCLQVALGVANTGLTLTASLVDYAFLPPASMPGFVVSVSEMAAGSGDYGVTLTNVADGFQGYAKLFDGTTYKGFVAVNPQEVENPDVRTSSVSGATDLAAILAILDEMHGLLGKHSRLMNASYSGTIPNELEEYDIWLYDNAGAAAAGGETGVTAKYHVVNTYNADHTLATSLTTKTA